MAEWPLFGTLPHGGGFPLVGGSQRVAAPRSSANLNFILQLKLMMIQFHGSFNTFFHALHTKFVMVTIFLKFCVQEYSSSYFLDAISDLGYERWALFQKHFDLSLKGNFSRLGFEMTFTK